MACSLFTALTPSRAQEAGRPDSSTAADQADADGDEIPNDKDNCPLTPNQGQEDGDADHLGDLCDTPYLRGLAAASPDGILQIMADERLRPISIASPEGLATLAWSDRSDSVELTVSAGFAPETFVLRVDLADEALRRTLAADEKQSGRNRSSLRQWLLDHPGQILSLFQGALPAPGLTPETTSLAPGRAGRMMVRPGPRYQADIEDYLYVLAVLAMSSEHASATFAEANTDLTVAAATARNILVDASIAAQARFDAEEAACHPCSSRCTIDCQDDTGACYLDPGSLADAQDPGRCRMLTEQACNGLAGVHFPDQRCPSACWLSTERSEPTCLMLEPGDCFMMGSLANQPGRGFDVTPVPCRGQACSDPMCTP
jgi:hypothetical protein